MQGLEFTYRAFTDLSTCREVGMAIGPIPWTAIRAYADTYDLGLDEFNDLVYHLGQMDAAYMDYHHRKAAEPKVGGKAGNQARRR